MKLYELAEKQNISTEAPIVLARVNGNEYELTRKVTGNEKIEFLTTKEKEGYECYRRSTVLLLLKSAYDIVGEEEIHNLRVLYSLGKGLYCELKMSHRTLDQALLEQIESRMRELVQLNLPIKKETITTEEAMNRFHKHHMYDKERLFSFRRSTTTNVYKIDEFEDYFYGCMVPFTGYITRFHIELYGDGFVLVMPEQNDFSHIPVFEPQNKLYATLKESQHWSKALKVSTVGALNDLIVNNTLNDLLLVQEALQEKKLAEIADQIISANKRIVLIAGPSSSGKTTFSKRLGVQLRVHGITPHPIGLDDYFINREDIPVEADGKRDYERLENVDIALFNSDLKKMLNGETVSVPHYNFISGTREYRNDFITLGEHDVLVIEGIHGLNEKLTPDIPKEDKFKIYISALTVLNIDEHNRIPMSDTRLIRRMVRDSLTRGASAAETIARWPSVRAGEKKHIYPFQEEADVMFNSAMITELAVLKTYAEPLLFSVPADTPEYTEAKRLLKFFDYVLGIDSKRIPSNSILREFIGGSCFEN
ncbi:MAG: nucleoside kinase [Lachnospiraceae bacterium]